MATQQHFIYGIVCPLDKRIVYVGRTSYLFTRLSMHKSKHCLPALKDWRDMLETKKLLHEVDVVILEKTSNSSKANERERYWIDTISKTHKLLNAPRNRKGETDRSPLTVEQYEKLSGIKISKP